MLSTPVIVLFVLMALCAVVGAIYAYLYFTRINPAGKGHRAAAGTIVWSHRTAAGTAGTAGHVGGSGGDPHSRQVASVSVVDEQLAGPSTHLFLFRKA